MQPFKVTDIVVLQFTEVMKQITFAPQFYELFLCPLPEVLPSAHIYRGIRHNLLEIVSSKQNRLMSHEALSQKTWVQGLALPPATHMTLRKFPWFSFSIN